MKSEMEVSRVKKKTAPLVESSSISPEAYWLVILAVAEPKQEGRY